MRRCLSFVKAAVLRRTHFITVPFTTVSLEHAHIIVDNEKHKMKTRGKKKLWKEHFCDKNSDKLCTVTTWLLRLWQRGRYTASEIQYGNLLKDKKQLNSTHNKVSLRAWMRVVRPRVWREQRRTDSSPSTSPAVWVREDTQQSPGAFIMLWTWRGHVWRCILKVTEGEQSLCSGWLTNTR